MAEGDHSIFVSEVVEAVVTQELKGRVDDAYLLLKDLGEKSFYER